MLEELVWRICSSIHAACWASSWWRWCFSSPGILASTGGPSRAHGASESDASRHERLLEIDHVSRRFAACVQYDVLVQGRGGEIVGLIGPNGAGKTTLVNVITGVHPATEGGGALCGQDVTRLQAEPDRLLGIARTFQIVQPFPQMTVGREHRRRGPVRRRRPRDRGGQGAGARDRLRFGLAALIDRPAATLTLAAASGWSWPRASPCSRSCCCSTR